MRSAHEIARFEERRQAAGCSEVSLECEEIAGGTMGYSHPGCWSNRAVGLGMDGPVNGADLDRLLRFYRERDCSPEIDVSPFNHVSLLRGLGERGFVVQEFDAVLVFDLAQVDRLTHPYGAPSGVDISAIEATDAAACAQWVAASTSGFRTLDQPIPEHQAAITHRIVQHPRVKCFLARNGQRAVGGAAAETFEGMGAIFGTSVVPDARGRGIQLALMLARLRWLAAQGASFTTVGSKPGIATERNARRLGFEMAYHRCTFVLGTARQE
ncbi:MAG: hypothetical protein O2816_10590 [Planctomycetota bacterium]|nr:hypothetical protein [Planctomycetota bacterium]